MSTANFNASLSALDWFGDDDSPTLEIGFKVVAFATATEAAAFDTAAAFGWESCWVENSRRNDFANFFPYEQRADLTTAGSGIAGRFSETDQLDSGLAANYQLVDGRFWGHLYVWTAAEVADPLPDRDRLLVAFADLIDQAAN